MNTSATPIYVGQTPPANPSLRTPWLSSALADARFPSHPGETYVAIDKGTSVSVQEPNVWTYNGTVYMLVNIGNQVLYSAPDPRGPWTSLGTVLGGGVGGEAGTAIHAGLYVEGDTLYLFYTGSGSPTSCKLATASKANPTAWSVVGTVLQKAGNTLAGLANFGNFACHKTPDGKYRLLFEGVFGSGSDSWITGLAESSVIGSGYQVVGGIIGSLNKGEVFGQSQMLPVPIPTNGSLDGYRATYSCGPVFYENGQYVQIFHAGEISSGDGGPRTELYRAKSFDGKQWAIDLWGYPVYARTDHRWELDQCADPYPVNINGVWWCFWTAAANPNNRFVVKGAPLSPTMKVYDGYGWVNVDQQGGDGGMTRRLKERSRYTTGPIFPFDDVPIDPGATVAFAVTLPVAAQGNEVRISNISTTTGTIAVSARSGDNILGTNATITAGQTVTYKCLKSNYWCRQG